MQLASTQTQINLNLNFKIKYLCSLLFISAETDLNRQGVFQGQLDAALSAVGVEQTKLVAKALRRIRFDRIYASDLQRAYQVRHFVHEFSSISYIYLVEE